MEKFRTDRQIHRLEDRWNSLSLGRQRLLIKVLLTLYIVLTACAVIHVWTQRDHWLSVGHIDGIPKNITLKKTAP